MLPLAILAGLIGAGMYISRREFADTLESPRASRDAYTGNASKASASMRPERSETPSRAKRLIPGPLGTGPVAHFSNAQVGALKQPPGILERSAGAAGEGPGPKRELPNFGTIHAQTSLPNIPRTRYAVGERRDGVSPIESERVAPIAESSVRRAVTPRTIDQLRSSANPKLDARGRLAAAPQRTTMRGEAGEVSKLPRRPDCEATMFAPGMASVARGADAGEHVLPQATCRDGAHLPLPGAGRNLAPGAYTVDGNSLRYSNSELCTPGGGAAGLVRARPRRNDIEMFESVTCAPERGSLPQPSLGGAGSAAMGTHGPVAARLTAGADSNRRALLSKNARMYAGVQIASNPPKQTVHDPEPLRTTLRETTVHDQGDGWIKGQERTKGRSPDAEARTTGRETLDDIQGAHGDGRLTGTDTVFKAPVYDPFDIFDTTTKETLENNRHTGNVGSIQDRGGAVVQPDLDQTQRGLSHREYFGDAAKPVADGYRVDESVAQGTNRQLDSHTDYRGGAGPTSAPAMMKGDELYARVFSNARESTLRRRALTQRRETLAVGADDIARSTRTRDPFLDVQPSRPGFENQSRSQKLVSPGCEGDTRGGRMFGSGSPRGGPDSRVLTQLKSNPFALQGPPV